MIAWDKHIKIWQFLGAILAVPAGVAGTYGAWQGYFSNAVSCPELRGTIITLLERNISGEMKRTLLHEDIAKFDENCAQKDPDTRAIFDAALAPPQTTGSHHANGVGAVAIFGLSKSGERRGWVALVRRDANRDEISNFETGGFPVTTRSPPALGAVVTARRLLPVWLEPQTANDPALLQGRLGEGACAKILSVELNTARLWAEVAPETCQ
jgi:hypothetical protein